MGIHEQCGYPESDHADFRINGACVIDLPDEPKRYEVTARLTIEAASAAEAVELFDQEYRDTLNVVHLQAREVTASEWADVAQGQRRNGAVG